jgi:mannitol-1-phosphate/altronate dehydrogenase
MPTQDEKYIDVESAVRLKEAEGKIEIEKYELETAARFRELEITEDAKEVASKHLAKFAGLYLTFLVAIFIFSIKFVPNESIAVVAGLITLVVSNLSAILKHIVENGKKEDKKKEEPEAPLPDDTKS